MKALALNLLAILISLAASVEAASSRCTCVANIYSKKYQHFEETWYGTRRAWSCEYICHNSQGETTKIQGSYKARYWTDNGTESVCEGIAFTSQFNAHTLQELYMPLPPAVFNPLTSKSSEIRSWAQAQSCE